MMYLVALVLPPLAMLLSGKPFQAMLAVILQITVIGWLPATIWACMVVNRHQADERTEKVIEATNAAAAGASRQAQAQAEATLALANAQAGTVTVPQPATLTPADVPTYWKR